MREQRDIKLVKPEKREKKLSHSEIILRKSTNEMNKTKVTINKPVCLGLSVVDISKIAMFEYWYGYLKPNCGDNVKLCYVDTDNLIVWVKVEDVYIDLAENVEKYLTHQTQ